MIYELRTNYYIHGLICVFYNKTDIVMLGQMWNITRRLVIANNKTKTRL